MRLREGVISVSIGGSVEGRFVRVVLMKKGVQREEFERQDIFFAETFLIFCFLGFWDLGKTAQSEK